MIKRFFKSVAAAIVCVSLVPVGVYAHNWQDSYCNSNEDGYSHTRYYYCDECGEEYSQTEPCSWKHDYYTWIAYGENGHYDVSTCTECYGTKQEEEACSWEFQDRACNDWNSSKHKVVTSYKCSLCDNEQDVITYSTHKNKWVRYNNNYWYECRDCGRMPKFNGSALLDSNDSDNITIRKKKTYKYNMYSFHKKLNPVKSIKNSKKKICTVKRKGKKLIIKGKKKGKCQIRVKMKSGATYVLKVRVK